MLLDLYGTCHDERIWDAPHTFRPERFAGREIDPFTLIPQGGGDHFRHHRCAGEWITLRVLGASLRFLLEELSYRVPPADLDIDLSKIPTQPANGFVIVSS